MKIGIIIVNYNSSKETLACLKSLKKCDNSDAFVLIVIDNMSEMSDYENLVNGVSEDIVIIRSDYNGGFSYGNNIGIKYALKCDVDYIMLLNNDTEVEADFDKYMIEALEKQGFGIVSPKILYYSNRDIIWAKGGQINWYFGGVNGCQNQKDDFGKEVIMADFLTGCCIMFKAELISEVGLLEENYFMYYEDVEFSDRVKSEGYELACVPQSIIYHKVGISSGGDNSPFMLEWSTRNHIKFLKKKFLNDKKIFWIIVFVYFRNLIRVIYYLFFKGRKHARAVLNGILK